MSAPAFARLDAAIASVRWVQVAGSVAQVVGLVIEADGPNAPIGEACIVETETGDVPAEVVGFRGDKTLLMPLGELAGVRAGCPVRSTGSALRVRAGAELCGRVLDGLGKPIDGAGELPRGRTVSTDGKPPSAMSRPTIAEPFASGVRAIDALLTLGEGQRVGIFAGSGVGKSTLLGMIARNCEADANVICLVGERGREVRDFIEKDLGEEGLRRSVVVCATSDQPALVRLRAAHTATAIAESLRDSGMRVMLLMDSVTRFAMAQREVGLSIGEPPATKGYTPSVFALLPKLMERAGTSPLGSITALYTVLVEGDDTNEPIADAARSILDGHLVLSRKLAARGHYPPIDVLQSLSRTMPAVVSPEAMSNARDARSVLAAYDDVEDLVSIGAYKAGTSEGTDRAIRLKPALDAFLRQRVEEAESLAGAQAGLSEALSG